MAVTEYRCMLVRRTGWQWPLGFGDRLELWDSRDIRVQVEIPALVNLLLAKALEADFVRVLVWRCSMLTIAAAIILAWLIIVAICWMGKPMP